MTASEEKYTRQTLLEVQPLTSSLFTLRTTRDAGFRFRAGQFARLGVTKADGSTVWRAYSMVSSPFDEFLEFFSIVVPGGEFTSELSRLEVGDSLLVDRQAFGYLTLDRFVDGRDLWLLSTGTGIAPFLSILQDFEVWEKFERIILVYSVREAKELAYQRLLAELPQREYLAEFAHKLQFISTVTREQHPGSLNGRITQLIENGELERAAGVELSPEHSRVMLCGNPQMIDDTRALLKQRGMSLSLTRRPGAGGGGKLLVMKTAPSGRRCRIAGSASGLVVLSLEQIADLPQQLFFLGRHRRQRRGHGLFALETVDHLDPMKMAKAMITKSMMLWMNLPYAKTTAGVSPAAALSVTARSPKFTPPISRPIGGMTTSPTKDETILPNAAPMMIPTAISTTLPLTAKALNSLSTPIGYSLLQMRLVTAV